MCAICVSAVWSLHSYIYVYMSEWKNIKYELRHIKHPEFKMWSSTALSYLYILFFTNIYIIWGSVVWRILMYVFLKSWMCDHWCKKQLCILSTKLFLYFCLCYVIVKMWKQTLCTKKYFSIIYKQHCKKSQYTVVENLYSSLTWHTSCTFPYIVILSCSFNFCLFHKVDFFRKDFQAEMFN